MRVVVFVVVPLRPNNVDDGNGKVQGKNYLSTGSGVWDKTYFFFGPEANHYTHTLYLKNISTLFNWSQVN